MGRARNRRKRKLKEEAARKAAEMSDRLTGWDGFNDDNEGDEIMTVYSGGAYYTASYGEPPCHVMTLGNVEIWAGSGTEMMEELHLYDLAFDLRGGFGGTSEAVVRPDTAAKTILPSHLYIDVTPPVIKLSWPDGGVLPVSRKWWEDLYDWIQEEYGEGEEEPKKIAVFCVGGHGRTGTFLSILAGLAGFGDAEHGCPVLWVREQYCPKAVESWDQIDYVAGVCRTEVFAVIEKKTVITYSAPQTVVGGGVKE